MKRIFGTPPFNAAASLWGALLLSLAVSVNTGVLAQTAFGGAFPDDRAFLAQGDAPPEGGGFPAGMGGGLGGGPGSGRFGGGMGRMGGSDAEARHQRMMQELGVSPEQQQKLKTLHEQGRAQSQALHQQLRTKQQALMQYMQSDNANETQARAMFNEVNALQRRMGELRIKSWFQMRQNLTPDQRTKLKQMMTARRQQMDGDAQGGFDGGRFGGSRGGFGGRFGSKQPDQRFGGGPGGGPGSFGPPDGAKP